jgi:y4mF family transcriptional regulator
MPSGDIIVPIGVIMEKIKDTKSLGMLIRQERKQQGLTQEQLAGVIGVGVRFLRELEAGKESCQIGRAMQVLAGLGLIVSVGRRQGPRS